ncbi:MAG: hypothetical protein OHK0057_34600 [Thermoflexibacter sp.]
MKKTNFLHRLQERWQLKDLKQVIIVLIVFALTGTTAMFVKRPIFAFLGITSDMAWWWRALVWCLTILPIYNVLLLIYGFIFGQFTFFWNFEKKFFRRLFGMK